MEMTEEQLLVLAWISVSFVVGLIIGNGFGYGRGIRWATELESKISGYKLENSVKTNKADNHKQAPAEYEDPWSRALTEGNADERIDTL